ncbi:hypothetical protein [Methylobacterium platani]|uniref:Uncharacterized protein n=2 Tax=Methylobacterium platani TaxID=427683 RepID=A0A179S9A6_9HYPH|nr:hypothetical protein [Methylobacterium platani]KMO22398.1 hypothetical protein SQ03_00510 [Methylobacterium platani JCM 14648]OAS22481.1 hypothetical protein A5481_18980 [Methylobacterium platani]
MTTDWNSQVFRNGASVHIRVETGPRDVTPCGEWTRKDEMRAEDMRIDRLASRVVSLDEVHETPWGGRGAKA